MKTKNNDFRDLWKIFKKLDDEQALASWLLRQAVASEKEQNKIYGIVCKYKLREWENEIYKA